MAKQDVNILEQFGSIMKDTIIKPAEDTIPAIAQKWLQERIDEAKQILANDGRNTTVGALSQSIVQGQFDLSEEGVVVMTVVAENYWKYINYGVNGTMVNQGSDMSFTTKAPPMSSMLNYIRDKAINQLTFGAKTINLDTPSKREGAAYVFAQAVKRKGIRKTPFIDDAFSDEQIDNLTKLLANIWQSQ